MVQRMLTEMFRFGLFDNPPTGNPYSTVTTPAHQATGTQVAEAGTTLLKNNSGTLPIPGRASTVAVIGPAGSMPLRSTVVEVARTSSRRRP